MGRKKNFSSKISKNTKIRAVNDADEVKKSDSGKQKFPSSVKDYACKPSYDMTNLCTQAISESNRLMALQTIFDSVTANPKERHRIVFFWHTDKLNMYYNEKFSCTLDIDAIERRRIATCLTEQCTLTDTTDKIKEISERQIGKVVVRTRKLPNELVDSKILNLINRKIGEYADSCLPMTRTAVARIIQAAQLGFDEATRKEKPRSAWKENIESKISKLVLSKDLLEKARKQEKLSTSETKSLKKIMREFNLNLSSVTDLSEALVKTNESLNVYEKKITMHESRKQFRKENRMFELFRGRFYHGLSERVKSEHVVSRDETVSFWSTMWNKNDDTVTYDDYLIPFGSDNHPTTFPSLDEFVNIINWLPNWKAAGIDGIYNFFIEKLTTLHKYIYDIVKVICLEGTTQADWFYCGLTYLIPKGIPRRGSDYRPITCMSNLYKLTTKCATKVVQFEGAKEQALLNIAWNKDYGNNLKATWIDVIISKWKIDISVGPEKIMTKKIDRGILQGDSLSPLFFVLCMDPLSRKLNEKYTKVTVQTDAESHSTNHLLFIDDLKLLAKDSSTLSAMTGEAKEFLEVIGLEINKEKSATNDTCCEDTATLLEGVSVYKYLGIIEDSRGIPTRSSFEEVQSKLISRVERLCHTRLNAKNLFSAINQHAISLINYHIGVLRLEPADFSKLDDAVRAVLVKNKI
ncbi:reverse transcriptase, partial [Hamiltosporidium tvaerminnensis]